MDIYKLGRSVARSSLHLEGAELGRSVAFSDGRVLGLELGISEGGMVGEPDG